MRDIWREVVEWSAAEKPFALARVMRTWGSAPRAAGAAMIVGEGMEVAGSVSGGCIEGAVIEAAGEVLKSGAAKHLRYGVEDEKAWSVGLSCGGQVEVLVERHWAFAGEQGRRVWAALCRAVEENRPVVLLTPLKGEGQLLIFPESGERLGDWEAGEEAVAAAVAAYADRESGVRAIGTEDVFAQVFARRDRALVVGAGHIAVPLVGFLKALEFETTVIDPRRVFARAVRFAVQPDQLVDRWPAEALAAWDLDEDTYAALLTHDPKIDDEALHLLLRSRVRYIGALGSRKTHARRLERLREAGFGEAETGRIRGPIGLDIGARTPAEIALSIAAEMVATRRTR